MDIQENSQDYTHPSEDYSESRVLGIALGRENPSASTVFYGDDLPIIDRLPIDMQVLYANRIREANEAILLPENLENLERDMNQAELDVIDSSDGEGADAA